MKTRQEVRATLHNHLKNFFFIHRHHANNPVVDAKMNNDMLEYQDYYQQATRWK